LFDVPQSTSYEQEKREKGRKTNEEKEIWKLKKGRMEVNK
jgi:hypothetical protein